MLAVVVGAAAFSCIAFAAGVQHRERGCASLVPLAERFRVDRELPVGLQ